MLLKKLRIHVFFFRFPNGRRFLLRHGRRKSSLTDIGEIAPRRQPQRALSVDLGDTGMPPQVWGGAEWGSWLTS